MWNNHLTLLQRRLTHAPPPLLTLAPPLLSPLFLPPLQREGARATLPTILKDEIEALLGETEVPPNFRLIALSIARIAMPESEALVTAITTDLDGSENPACVAAAAAGLAALPGKQLLGFMAKSTEGGTWSCKTAEDTFKRCLEHEDAELRAAPIKAFARVATR